ncbi:MAG: arginine--tRNA ligase [Gammaproteobacteria bacterium]|nr:arginine--tRNA ligase [Gammaproteobacteria bacterium]
MKARLEQHLNEVLEVLKADGLVPTDTTVDVSLSRTKDPSHGDFASNLAMVLAKPAKKPPREMAQAIIDALPANSDIQKVEIAGPGFINFHLSESQQASVVKTVLAQKEAFGRSTVGAGQRLQVEYVSANPTGPLHVGHGRGAALGATMANMLSAAGFDVQREYYVNDAGRQMDILATSVWLRYLERSGQTLSFPSNGYKGDYIFDIADTLRGAVADRLDCDVAEAFAEVRPDEPDGGDKEQHIDDLIANARKLLSDSDYKTLFDHALNAVLEDIQADLAEFGVIYDEWFSERSIQSDIARAIETLNARGYLYEKEGAQWFRSTDFGDDKDRVVVRDNGQTTYFASDLAYINNKMERGFDQVLYVFGADHHGYTARMLAAAEALGHDPKRLKFLLIQFANLYRGGERVPMTTRGGSFVTIRELRDEVGKDAARYFYVMRKYQQHLDFDLDLAKSQSNENPVYYVQYAHARICSVLRQLSQRGMTYDEALGLESLARLDTAEESELLTLLDTYPEILERAALSHEPHQITGYLRDLANALHTYYNAHKVLLDDEPLRNARLSLLLAVKQVLVNGLTLIDVSTPEVM